MRKLTVIVLLLALAVFAPFTFAQSGGDTADPFGSSFDPPDVETFNEVASSGTGSESGVASESMLLSPTQATINIPPGAQIDVTDGLITSSEISAAQTKANIDIRNCEDVSITADGHVSAKSCRAIDLGPVRFTRLTNLFSDGTVITFDEARGGITSDPVPIQFPLLGTSTITVTNNKLTKAVISFKRDSLDFEFPNPLAFDQGTYQNHFLFIDSDNDGLADQVEENTGTNPNNQDTDGDGVTDKEELLTYPLDPNKQMTFVNLALKDDQFIAWAPDNVNRITGGLGEAITEAQLSGNNLWIDSDADGISDLMEVRYRLGWQTADSDGDNWLDGEEIARGFSPYDPNSPGTFLEGLSCTDCVVAVRPTNGGSLTLDYSSFVGNLPGSKISYDFIGTELAIQSKNVISESTDVTVFTVNDSSIPGSVSLTKGNEFYDTTTNNIITLLDGFKILDNDESDFFEVVAGNNVRYTWHPVEGIVTMQLSSPGLYQYNFKTNWSTGPYAYETKSWAQSFSIHRPVGYETSATLHFDKPTQPVTEEQFLLTYGSREETSYISLKENTLLLEGALTYSRPEFTYQGLTPIGSEYVEGTPVVAELEFSSDQLRFQDRLFTQPYMEPEFQRNGASDILVFEAPASLVRVVGTPGTFQSVWESTSKSVQARIDLDPTNLLATLTFSGEVQDGERYRIAFDDMHLYGGVDTTAYQYAGISRPGSGALVQATIGSATLVKEQGIVKFQDRSSIAFYSAGDDSSSVLTEHQIDYAGNLSNICGRFDAWHLSEEDRGKTLLGFLAGFAVLLVIPARWNKKGFGVSLFIMLVVFLILFSALVLYIYPSWVDAIFGKFLQSPQLEAEKEVVNSYTHDCYELATQCWLYRTGLNDGSLVTPFERHNGASYIADAGTECSEQFESQSQYNLRHGGADVDLSLNADDVTVRVDPSIVLKRRLSRARTADQFVSYPVRYASIQELVRTEQGAEHMRESPHDLDLIPLREQDVHIDVYEVNDRSVFAVNDPASFLQPGLVYRWMWAEPKI